jgi:putative acetyltransferase
MEEMGREVRAERPGDFAAIRLVQRRAFAPSEQEADIVEALRASGDYVPALCLVAVLDGEVVGHAAFSRARLDPEGQVLVLGPIAVLPEHQREGFGSALILEGLRRAEETEFPVVVVVGHPDYYPRFGFEPAAALGLTTPAGHSPDAWMAHRLPAFRPDVRGSVIFPDAFGM